MPHQGARQPEAPAGGHPRVPLSILDPAPVAEAINDSLALEFTPLRRLPKVLDSDALGFFLRG